MRKGKFVGVGGGAGDSAYLYIAWASAADGTGFTMVFDPALKYIAVKTTTEPITAPVVGDFAGLWVKYVGENGQPGYTPQKGVDYFDGDDGYTPYIQGGYWYINGINTGVTAIGANGKNTEMSVQAGYICWRLVGDPDWIQLVSTASLKGDPGTAGRGITSIVLQSTVGKVKTYRITFTDATTFDYEVSDGADGTGGTGSDVPELHLDFEESGDEFVYNVPYDMKFTSIVCEGTSPTLSIALNTVMARYTKMTITATTTGLVSIYGEYVTI